MNPFATGAVAPSSTQARMVRGAGVNSRKRQATGQEGAGEKGELECAPLVSTRPAIRSDEEWGLMIWIKRAGDTHT